MQSVTTLASRGLEPPGPVTMQRIIGGVEVQLDPRRRPRPRLQEHVDEEVLSRLTIHGNLFVAAPAKRTYRRELQPIRPTLSRQGLAPVLLPGPMLAQRIGLIRQYRSKQIATRSVVIVEVFVRQTQRVDALAINCSMAARYAAGHGDS